MNDFFVITLLILIIFTNAAKIQMQKNKFSLVYINTKNNKFQCGFGFKLIYKL